MARYARESEAGPKTLLGQRIAVANAAGLYANAHLTGPWLRKFFLDEFKRSARGGNLHGAASN